MSMTDLAMSFREHSERTLEFCAGKNRMLRTQCKVCGVLEDNAESNADNGSLAMKLERESQSLSWPFM